MRRMLPSSVMERRRGSSWMRGRHRAVMGSAATLLSDGLSAGMKQRTQNSNFSDQVDVFLEKRSAKYKDEFNLHFSYNLDTIFSTSFLTNLNTVQNNPSWTYRTVPQNYEFYRTAPRQSMRTGIDRFTPAVLVR